MSLAFIPICALLINIENVLVLCGQKPEVAEHAALYIHVYLPGLYLMALCDLEKKLLINLGKNDVCFYNTLFGVVFRILSTVLFVVYYDLKILGTGLAQLLTSVVLFSHIHLYGRS